MRLPHRRAAVRHPVRRALALLLGCLLLLVRVSTAAAACAPAEAPGAAAAAHPAAEHGQQHAPHHAPDHAQHRAGLPGDDVADAPLRGGDSHHGPALDCATVHCAALTTTRAPAVLAAATVDGRRAPGASPMLGASDVVYTPTSPPPRG